MVVHIGKFTLLNHHLGSKNSWNPCNFDTTLYKLSNCINGIPHDPAVETPQRSETSSAKASLPRLPSEREGLAVLAIESISGWFTGLQILHLSPCVHECMERNKIAHPSKSKSRNKNYSAPVLGYHDRIKHVCVPPQTLCFWGCLCGQSLHIRVTVHAQGHWLLRQH